MYYMYYIPHEFDKMFCFHHGFSAMKMIKASRLVDRERERWPPIEGHENQATATKRKSVILLGFRCACLSV